ncbi:phosphatase PAP2 family protein [Luteimonas sp. RIT-PG2_3]
MSIASRPPGVSSTAPRAPSIPGAATAAIPRPWHPQAIAFLTVVLLVALALLANQSGLDLWLADRIYAAQGFHWALRHHVLTCDVLHDGGRKVSQLAWAGVVIAWLVSRRIGAWRPWQGALGRLALSVLLATVLIAALKQLIPVYCPWDLVRYGGTANLGDGGGVCFPAGHASAGYAWMALARLPRTVLWRRVGLATGIAAGLLFGLDQQLRGAHFLSHDLWTAALCWAVAVVVSPSAKERAA